MMDYSPMYGGPFGQRNYGYPPYPAPPQNQPAPPQGPQNPPGLPQGFACRPVTSREEAVATAVDFASPGTLLPDFAHGMIYFKRFNANTGGSDFLAYALQTEPPSPPAPSWASAQEVEELRGAVRQLSEKLKSLEGKTNEPAE